MKFRMLIIIAAAFLLSFNTASSADVPNIDGSWKGKCTSGQGGPMDMDYMFKAYGSFLTGTTIGGANGERIPILNGRINGNKISFTVMLGRIIANPSQITIQRMKFDYTGEISGDKLKLKFVRNDDKNSNGSFTVNRVKEKKGSSSPALQDFDYESERQRAFEVFRANDLLGARALLEKLHDVKPDDAETLEALAYATLSTTITEKDAEKQRAIRLQARAMAERAKELGGNNALVQLLIEQILPDGTHRPQMMASAPSPAMEALTAAESALFSGKADLAIEHYERAAQLDPALYEVPLFTGDAYFQIGKMDKAYEYYARAVAINPDRETAWRYWGDVLMRENKLEEAKEKLIESVIAEPYSRMPWQFIANWGNISKIQLGGHPRIDIPENPSSNPNSANKDGSSAWTNYGISRAAWRTADNKRFFEAFPNEKEYRHSLLEEYIALNAAAESVHAQLEEGSLRESDLGESIANLLKLYRDDLLEAYILLARPDDGIVCDYAEYRKNNRDKLRRYLNEYVTAKK